MKFVPEILLCLLLVVGSVGADPVEERVSFATEDGVALQGTLTMVSSDFVVLANQHHATEILWLTLVPELTARGWSALSYDNRGVGRSPGVEAIPSFDKDVAAAYRYALTRGARRVVLLGASLGAIAVLKAAGSVPTAGLILLSAAKRDEGLELGTDPRSGISAPVLFITSEYDTFRTETEDLAALFGTQAELLVVPAGDHGTALLDGPYGDEVLAKVSAFLQTVRETKLR